MKRVIFVFFAFLLAISFGKTLNTLSPKRPTIEIYDYLSEFGFFEDSLNELKPTDKLIPYELNSPLFSDYAYKARFVHIPEGTKIKYKAEGILEFPIGTFLIKNFYYPKDFRKPHGERFIIETRLLVLEEEDWWMAYPYIWNKEQTDAEFDATGSELPIEWIHNDGKKKKINYQIPNRFQCKSCHTHDTVPFRPIGLSARQLNRDFQYAANYTNNQLKEWEKRGWLEGLPSDMKKIPKMADWQNMASGSLDERARAYLDANCAHCHNEKGTANTSGMFLDIYQKDAHALGIGKAPVAAGRGGGNLQYGIVKGKPKESIMVYRMSSTESDIRMPELGRVMLHPEGIKLISEWIKKM